MKHVGATLEWSITVTDEDGHPANTGITPTATVTQPDGTIALADVSSPGVGVYVATYVSSMAGRHLVVWQAWGVNSGDFPYTDQTDVWPINPRYLIGLGDARAQLKLPAGVTVHDDDLLLYIAAATPIIEDLVSAAVLPQTVEERRDGGGQVIRLWRGPVRSMTGITEDGVSLVEGEGFVVDEAGLVWRGTSPRSACWRRGARNVVITYEVGPAQIHPAVLTAARELVAHQVQARFGPRPAMPTTGDTPYTLAAGFAVPNAVVEKLQPVIRHRLPGIG